MIYLMKHVFQIEDLSLTVFNNVNVNVDLLEEIEIQINAGIMINVNMSVKNVMYVGKIMFGIMLHVIVKMENIWQVLWIIQLLCVMQTRHRI